VFVEREWLAAEFKQGKSLEQVGRETGLHASTVAYWARKHGLRPLGAKRFAPRGAPDRELLERLAREGASLREIAQTLDRSIATVRHWLRKWSVERVDARKAPLPPDAPREAAMPCSRHGLTRFRLIGGRYRCKRCDQERVAERRQEGQADPCRRRGWPLPDLRLRPLRGGASVPSSGAASKELRGVL
jgi:transposase-like protein